MVKFEDAAFGAQARLLVDILFSAEMNNYTYHLGETTSNDKGLCQTCAYAICLIHEALCSYSYINQLPSQNQQHLVCY